MKIKTSELKDLALDWAVDRIESPSGPRPERAYGMKQEGMGFVPRGFHPSTDWSQGGPIIAKLMLEGLLLQAADPEFKNMPAFRASFTQWADCQRGETPLIAAMKGYVARELGAEVDIPDDLLIPSEHSSGMAM